VRATAGFKVLGRIPDQDRKPSLEGVIRNDSRPY